MERIERREKEEGTMSKRYRIATVVIPYIVFLFCVLRATVGYFFFLRYAASTFEAVFVSPSKLIYYTLL